MKTLPPTTEWQTIADAFGSRATSAPGVKRFQELLQTHGIPVTVRHRRGIEIAAGCGQLAAAVN